MADRSLGDASLSGQVLRLAALVAGLVVAAVLAAEAASTSVVAGMLAAVLAGCVAAIALHGILRARVIRPMERVLAALGLPSTSAVPDLEAAVADLQRQAQRLKALEAQTSALRHDLRGMLSPALLTADRLTEHEDPKVSRTGQIVVRAINRATERLSATKDPPLEHDG